MTLFDDKAFNVYQVVKISKIKFYSLAQASYGLFQDVFVLQIVCLLKPVNMATEIVLLFS